jgi:hypothetical protein
LALGTDEVVDEGQADAVASTSDDTHHVSGGKRANFPRSESSGGLCKRLFFGADFNVARFHRNVDGNAIRNPQGLCVGLNIVRFEVAQSETCNHEVSAVAKGSLQIGTADAFAGSISTDIGKANVSLATDVALASAQRDIGVVNEGRGGNDFEEGSGRSVGVRNEVATGRAKARPGQDFAGMDVDNDDSGFLGARLGNKGGDVALQFRVDGEDSAALFGGSGEATVDGVRLAQVDLWGSGGGGKEARRKAGGNEGESPLKSLDFSQS